MAEWGPRPTVCWRLVPGPRVLWALFCLDSERHDPVPALEQLEMVQEEQQVLLAQRRGSQQQGGWGHGGWEGPLHSGHDESATGKPRQEGQPPSSQRPPYLGHWGAGWLRHVPGTGPATWQEPALRPRVAPPGRSSGLSLVQP